MRGPAALVRNGAGSPPASLMGSRSMRHRLFRREAMLLGGLLVLATAVVSGTGSSYNIFLLTSVLLATLGALALNLLMGTAGQVSIGNSAFLATGAFAAVAETRAGLPFPADLIGAAVVAGAIGLIVGLPALRIKGLYLALATLAAFYVVTFAATQYQSNAVGPAGFVLNPIFVGSPEEQARRWSWVACGVVICCLTLVTLIEKGRSGRAWRLIRQSESAASLVGIPVATYKLLAFVITSAIIGIQGALAAHVAGSVSSDSYTIQMAVTYIAMIFIGGLDSMTGSLIGAALVTLLPHLSTTLLQSIFGADQAAKSAAYSQILYGVLIVVCIVYAPRGIVGLSHDLTRWARSRRLAHPAAPPTPTAPPVADGTKMPEVNDD